jgi:hypothetical protein
MFEFRTTELVEDWRKLLFQDARRKQETDVRLVCSDRVEIGGHRLVLMMSSKMFADMLFKEKSDLLMVPFNSNAVESMLKIMYCGEATFASAEAAEVDALLQFFKIDAQALDCNQEDLQQVFVHMPKAWKVGEELEENDHVRKCRLGKIEQQMKPFDDESSGSLNRNGVDIAHGTAVEDPDQAAAATGSCTLSYLKIICAIYQ